MRRINPTILHLPVDGLNLCPGTLGTQLTGPFVLLAFLRHLGCLFCREMVADLKRAAADATFPPVLMVTQSPPDHARPFFGRYWPPARVICDPARELYRDFGIARATFSGGFGPAVWTCGLRAVAKGNTQSMLRPVGDPWLLPATVLLTPSGEVAWEHRARYVGDRPDYRSTPRLPQCRPAPCALNALP